MSWSPWMVALLTLCLLALPGCGGEGGDTTSKDTPGKPGESTTGQNKPPTKPVFAITGKPGLESPQAAVLFVAECLNSGEFEKFWTLAVTVEDVKTFDQTSSLLASEASLDVLEKSQLGLYLFKMTRADMTRHKRSWREGFESVRGKLNFSEASRGGVVVDVQQQGELKWVNHAMMFFTVDDRSYELKVGKLLLTPRGWLILDDDPLKLVEAVIDDGP